MSQWITWDVEDVETGEVFPYLFERHRVPEVGERLKVQYRGVLREVRRIFSVCQQRAQVRKYDGQIESTLPTRRHALQRGLPLAPGYDPKTDLPRFTSRAAINKYAAALNRSKAYGEQEAKWKDSND